MTITISFVKYRRKFLPEKFNDIHVCTKRRKTNVNPLRAYTDIYLKGHCHGSYYEFIQIVFFIRRMARVYTYTSKKCISNYL